METSKNHRDGLMVILIKILICLIFCLLATRTVRAQMFKDVPRPLNKQQHREKVKQIYTSQIGVREKHGNSGKEVEKYLRYVHLPKGNPWCAAFVCWAFGEANVPNPRNGWSPDLFPASKTIWKKLTVDSGQLTKVGSILASSHQLPTIPSIGDVFGLYIPEKGRIAHVGFVDEWKEPWVTTVEGNTNELGSREGNGVYRKRRLTRSIFRLRDTSSNIRYHVSSSRTIAVGVTGVRR